MRPKPQEPPHERRLRTIVDIAQLAQIHGYAPSDKAVTFAKMADELQNLRRLDSNGDETFNGIPYRDAVFTIVMKRLGKESGSREVPPDPDGLNGRRSGWAASALVAFMQTTGTDQEDAVADLLSDLIHWCDRHMNGTFEHQLSRARGMYEDETYMEE